MTDELNQLLNQLAKISPQGKKIAELIRVNDGRHALDFARSMDIQSPAEEAIIQEMVNLLEVAPYSGGEEQKVRRDMEVMFAEGGEILDPAVEEEWESKLQAARTVDRANFEQSKLKSPVGTKKAEEKPLSLKDVKGLGDASVVKLQDQGIQTPAEFFALSFEQKKNIVGPIVADRFKDENTSTAANTS